MCNQAVRLQRKGSTYPHFATLHFWIRNSKQKEWTQSYNERLAKLLFALSRVPIDGPTTPRGQSSRLITQWFPTVVFFCLFFRYFVLVNGHELKKNNTHTTVTLDMSEYLCKQWDQWKNSMRVVGHFDIMYNKHENCQSFLWMVSLSCIFWNWQLCCKWFTKTCESSEWSQTGGFLFPVL